MPRPRLAELPAARRPRRRARGAPFGPLQEPRAAAAAGSGAAACARLRAERRALRLGGRRGRERLARGRCGKVAVVPGR